MRHASKIAILGGTGKSGKYLVMQLLRHGFDLKLLLRNPEGFQVESPLVEVVEGDARDYKSVETLLEDCQVVISTLGQPKGEPAIFSQASKNVLRAMNCFNIERYILTAGLNVDTPSDKKGTKTQMATDWMRTNYPETTNDRQVEFNILSNSEVSWTLVRLPLIVQTEQRSKIVVSLEDCLGDEISATDLAYFLIGQLSDNTYIRKAPFIANS